MKTAGCNIAILIVLLILLPIWFVMYWALDALDAPSWVWGLYWVYIPLSVIIETATDDD